MIKAYLDSNYILRLVLADIPAQHKLAVELFKKIEAGELVGRLCLLVVNEVLWIAEHYYEWDRKLMVERLLKILDLKGIEVVEMNKQALMALLERYAHTKTDFTDMYLDYVAAENVVASFDKHLAKLGAVIYSG